MPDDLTSRGIAALKAGDRLRARQLLAAVMANPNDEQAWRGFQAQWTRAMPRVARLGGGLIKTSG